MASEKLQTIVFNTTVCVRPSCFPASCKNAALGNVGRLRHCPPAATEPEGSFPRGIGGKGRPASHLYRDVGTVFAKSDVERDKSIGKGIEHFPFATHRRGRGDSARRQMIFRWLLSLGIAGLSVVFGIFTGMGKAKFADPMPNRSLANATINGTVFRLP